MLLSWHDAFAKCNEYKILLDARKRCNNLAVRMESWSLIGKILKLRLHSATLADEEVQNIFINKRTIANSMDCLSLDWIGQTSVANNIGKHLASNEVNAIKYIIIQKNKIMY